MSAASLLTELTIPEELASIVSRRTQNLQMLPAIAIQALEVAKDPDCTINEFTAVVERDVKLASDTLSMANSVMFSTGRPVSSLHQSVVRLGFRQCRNLILSTSMSSLMKKISLDQEWIRETLWRHGFLTAMVALNVNRTVAAGFQGEEFAAGLIHDFGRTLLAVCLPDSFADIDSLSFEEHDDVLHQEDCIIGTNHCELGAWFAKANKLPAELIDVIRYHHTPQRSVDFTRLVALTAVSDHMANHLQHGVGANGYDISTNSAAFVLERCGVRNAAARLSETCETIMEAVLLDAVDLMAT